MPDPAPPSFRPSDPRIAFLVAAAVVAASLATIPDARGMLLAFVFTTTWHLAVTRRLRATARVLRRLVPLMLVVFVINAVLVPGEPLLVVLGRRIVSWEGFENGVFFALRLAVMLMAVAAFVASSSPDSMARGAYDMLRRISGAAASRAALFVFLAMSFVPLFAGELERIRIAQAFRGGDFTGGVTRRADTVRTWLVPLLISAVHRSGELAKTVELRRIRERLVHTIEPPRMRAADLVLATMALVVVAFASVWA
jgi:energy-coupling factor transport system permease protein